MGPETTAPHTRTVEDWWAVLGGPDIRKSPAATELRRRLAFELQHAYHGEIPEPPHTRAEAVGKLENDKANAVWVAWLIWSCGIGCLSSPMATGPNPKPYRLTPDGVKRALKVLEKPAPSDLTP